MNAPAPLAVHSVPRFDPWRGRNPIVWRERLLAERASAGWRERWRLDGLPGPLTGVVLLIVATLVLCPVSRISLSTVALVGFALSGLALWVLLPLSVAALPAHLAVAICRERELGTWEILHTTPLSAGDIVLGKLFAGVTAAPLFEVLVALGPVQAVCGALSAVALVAQQESRPGALTVALIVAGVLMVAIQPLVHLLYAGTLLLAISSVTRSSQVAVGVGYVALGITYFAPVTLLALLTGCFTLSLLGTGPAPLFTLFYVMAIPVLLLVALLKTRTSE